MQNIKLCNLQTDVLISMSKQKPTGTGFINVLKSAMSAAFGVQSSKNRERDFTQGKPIHFIIAGIFLTLSFLLFIGLMVKIMIATAG